MDVGEDVLVGLGDDRPFVCIAIVGLGDGAEAFVFEHGVDDRCGLFRGRLARFFNYAFHGLADGLAGHGRRYGFSRSGHDFKSSFEPAGTYRVLAS